jgi:threonine dehydratase
MVEGGGATALAGLLARRDEFAGQRVAVMCSGGNITEPQVRAVLDQE